MVGKVNFSTTGKYKTDSGLGGSFSLAFLREECGAYVFKVTTPGWEKELRFSADNINNVKQA